MVQCNRCNLQYIGETRRRLEDRFNEHRRAVDKTNIKSTPTTVPEHFLSPSNVNTKELVLNLNVTISITQNLRKTR